MSVDNESTGVERDYSAAVSSQAKTAAVHYIIDGVSTSFDTPGELAPSWDRANRRMNNESRSADSTRSTAVSCGPISSEHNLDSSHKLATSHHAINSSARSQTLESHSAIDGMCMDPRNRANKMGDGMVVNQVGDRIHKNTDDESDEKRSRTVQIADVDEDLVDMIELYVEHRKRGGGEVENFEYVSERRNLMVVFVDAKGLGITSLCYKFNSKI